MDWFLTLEASSLDIISRFVAEGFGIGLSIATPKSISNDQVCEIPLPGFPHIEFGA